MGIQNTFNGNIKNIGPKTPETDKLGDKDVEQNEDAKSSGDSDVQDGKNVVNEQEQNDIVNGTGAEEYVENAANNNTKMANESTLTS